MKHLTGDKGDIGVARITADLIEKGIPVFIPVSSTCPFDLLGFDNEFKRIQVKYRTPTKRNTIEVRMERAIISNSKISKTYNFGVDIIAIFCPDTNKCYYVKTNGNMKSITLRLEKPKNNQTTNINNADDFLEFPTDP